MVVFAFQKEQWSESGKPMTLPDAGVTLTPMELLSIDITHLKPVEDPILSKDNLGAT